VTSPSIIKSSLNLNPCTRIDPELGAPCSSSMTVVFYGINHSESETDQTGSGAGIGDTLHHFIGSVQCAASRGFLCKGTNARKIAVPTLGFACKYIWQSRTKTECAIIS
jgi:hypothetical protein